jgi:hypothetical protein
MRRALALAALAILPVVPLRAAEAGKSCGGGGSSGGHGGGSGHGSTSRSDCTDTSDVVGYRKCTAFGMWGRGLELPHIIIEAGAVVRQFDSLLDGQTGTVTHGGESFAYRVIAPVQRRRSLDTAVLSTMRAGIGLPHGLYTALEVDLGGLVQPDRATAEMMSTGAFGTPDVEQHGGFEVDSLATVGVRGALRAGSVGVELAGGMRAVSYRFQSDYHDCERSVSITAYGPIAEARVRGELWVSPWLAAGVTVGTSVIERNTWMGGLYIGVHSRAFGGER